MHLPIETISEIAIKELVAGDSNYIGHRIQLQIKIHSLEYRLLGFEAD